MIERINYTGFVIAGTVFLVLLGMLMMFSAEWVGDRIDHLKLTMRIWKKNVKLKQRNKQLEQFVEDFDKWAELVPCRLHNHGLKERAKRLREVERE